MPPRASKPDPILAKLRAICLALPDTKETLTWGAPHFRVGEKIFAGYGEEKGMLALTFKLEMDHADAVVQDPRFRRAPYVGHKGWVSLDAARIDDWDEVGALVAESYRLIAPKRAATKPAAKKRAATKLAAKKRAGGARKRT